MCDHVKSIDREQRQIPNDIKKTNARMDGLCHMLHSQTVSAISKQITYTLYEL